MQRGRPALLEPGVVVLLWLRVVLLVVLSWGALVTALSVNPPLRPLGEFRAALRAGEVSYVIAEGSGRVLRDLRWSSGTLFWSRAILPVPGTSGYSQTDLNADLSVVYGPPPVDWRIGPQNGRGFLPRWPFHVPVPYGSWPVGAAWVLALLGMLSVERPRAGNRWAWFWLFTVGRVGAILFLVLEPRPLWRPFDDLPPPSSRLGGGRGCLLSLVMSVISAVAAYAVGEAVEAVVLTATGL
ncbi:hypothetical protein ACWEN6_22390 [Sphaerisporangium sp. NPDC004334]